MAENELTAILLDINWGLMVISTIGYFIGGYLLYGSLYAAVGGSVQSEQEGQGHGDSRHHAPDVCLHRWQRGHGESRNGGT